MYDWLDDSLRDDSHVLTASRRLARLLTDEYSSRRIAAGATAWPTPHIASWTGWLTRLLSDSRQPDELPLLIRPAQSLLLWERCLRREIRDPLVNVGMLARQCRDAWARLSDWQVSIAQCQAHSRNADQRLFAKIAHSYTSILARERWIDDAGLAGLVSELVAADAVRLPKALTLAGFDRLTPQAGALLAAVEASGCRVVSIQGQQFEPQVSVRSAADGDAELRAAGRWARDELAAKPDCRLAIVVSQLEADAARCLRLVKEGLIPGWQTASRAQNAVINVSYGRKLNLYPAIADALLALRWLHSDLSSADVSRLLRSGLFATETGDARSRIEMRLRSLPARNWSPQMLFAEVTAWGENPDVAEFLTWLKRIVGFRQERGRRQTPAGWITQLSGILAELGWPGTVSLDSDEFQLINRWRELLNDVAHLQLVSTAMTLPEVLGRISSLAGDTVYQPEAAGAVVHVLGPLEAAGMQFDRLWISGMTSTNWPPPRRPLALVSSELQRSAGMPDASPEDTLEYASRVVDRLISSAAHTVCSYAITDNDATQSPSELLPSASRKAIAPLTDPGWAAAGNRADMPSMVRVTDPAPPMFDDEILAGGAASLQAQFTEPFAAFVAGRLNVRRLPPILNGLPAGVRGNIVHQALHKLYADCPDQARILGWSAAEIETRIAQAIRSAFWPHERNADPVLQQLLQLEKARVEMLLADVIKLDLGRESFRIDSVEQKIKGDINGLQMRLRIDRVDQLHDGKGGLVVLDYKTGTAKKLLDRNNAPRDIQLLVYAHVLPSPVQGIGLINVDTRATALEIIGKDTNPRLDWDSWFAEWSREVELAAAEIVAGDVRINIAQSAAESRPVSLLGRHRELLRDN